MWGIVWSSSFPSSLPVNIYFPLLKKQSSSIELLLHPCQSLVGCICVAFSPSFLFYSVDLFVLPSQWTPQHSISVGCSADRTDSGDKKPGVAQTYQILVVLSCVGFWGLVFSLAKLGWYSFYIYPRGVCFENFYTMYSHMTSSCKHFLIPSLIQSDSIQHWLRMQYRGLWWGHRQGSSDRCSA